MKSIIRILIAVLFLSCVAVGPAKAETLSWENPTTYVDGTVFTDSEKTALSTTIEIKGAAEADYQVLTVVTGGAASWIGSLPATYLKGSTVQFRAKSTLNSLDSAYSDVISYTIPYVAPNGPKNIIVITVTH